jgi:poly(3-hydroxybutyrate) depolymerase
MLYQAYEAQQLAMRPLRVAAGLTQIGIESLGPRVAEHPLARLMSANCEMTRRSGLIHERPSWGIDQVSISGRSVAVHEEVANRTPFGSLLHFVKDATAPAGPPPGAARRRPPAGSARAATRAPAAPTEEPRVLLVTALAGHFSTLLRDTVATMLPHHDMYVTDWHNARDVPLDEGRFGLDDYIAHMVDWLEFLGPGTHVLAVCQPCPATIAATSILAARNSPAQPRTLTLMAGPVDTRINPTAVNDLATNTPLKWFSDNVVDVVPLGHAGAGRRVYPGFVQLSGFVSMNAPRHFRQQLQLYGDLIRGNTERAKSVETFYDEYFAVLDMSADFYLETVDAVFMRNLLPKGELYWRGEHVEPGKVRRTALLTVEGANDDVCGMGQTLAAHDLFTGISPRNKRHHLQAGVGHYGVFSGRRWQQEIEPVVRNFILQHA